MDFISSLERKIITLALEEDKVSQDVTTNSLLSYDSVVSATVRAKETGIISGTSVFKSVFYTVDPQVIVNIAKEDGSKVCSGDIVIRISGLKSSILKAERTALNFLQRLSGIASITNRYVKKLEGSDIKLLDTRKTTPGMRYMEKKAVLDGGGTNHRLNLEDMAMIKDNHIKMAGSISKAVDLIRKNAKGIKIEVEVTNLSELKEALSKHVDIIMLDNFKNDLLKSAIKIKGNDVKFEISGNVTFDNINNKIYKGIDFISSGSLTHSFKSLDLSLKIDE